MVTSGAKLTLSDDSHGTGDVGFWYNNLPQYLSDNNIAELHYLEGPSEQASQVICKKLVNCLNHPFWTNCVRFLEDN